MISVIGFIKLDAGNGMGRWGGCTRVSKKELLWACRLANQHKVAFPARNVLIKHGDSTLKFGPRSMAPIIRVESLELWHKAHPCSMLIQKLLTRKEEFK